jgi:hypothetical protein
MVETGGKTEQNRSKDGCGRHPRQTRGAKHPEETARPHVLDAVANIHQKIVETKPQPALPQKRM